MDALNNRSSKNRKTAQNRKKLPRRNAWLTAGLCLGTGFVALLISNCGGDREPSEAVPAERFTTGEEWKLYRDRFVTDEGRVLDTANADVTHTEAVGYALLLAEHFADRECFDRIWGWTVKHLRVRDDALFAWRWQPTANEGAGGADDPNNATDGDLLIAWALIRAANRWNETELTEEASKILDTVRKKLVRQTPAGPVLLPGEYGFEHEGGRITVNPSYWVFPALQSFARHDSAAPEIWLELMASGLRLLKHGKFGEPVALPGDWLVIEPDGSVALPETANFPAEFGYNAVRIPLYLTWAGFRQKSLLEPFVRYPESCRLEDGRTAAIWNLQNAEPGPDPAMNGSAAIFKLCAAVNADEPITLSDLPPLIEDDAYYSSSLLLLTKIALTELNDP